MKLYILNGPNLNMLGIREPDHYGTTTYEDLCEMIREHCEDLVVECVLRQTNHEGELVDYIQEAYFEDADGIVINPGAYTHTSIAILDAAKATRLPLVEVHISKVEEREAYRQVSYIREAAIATITGKGTAGYLEAIDLLCVKKR
ncbi:MAG: 3-dehydroquinate dehydratase [Clostridia bacterium]|nr:3-dehydroquinate dehydratase [Clostridia bacterium]